MSAFGDLSFKCFKFLLEIFFSNDLVCNSQSSNSAINSACNLEFSSDSSEIVNKRMSKAKSEISHWIEYDYVLINEDLTKCRDDVVTILQAERKKRDRQKFIFGLIEKLLK